MIRRIGKFNSLLLAIVFVGDLLIYNIIYLLSYRLQISGILNLNLQPFKLNLLIIFDLAYLICIYRHSNTLQKRNIRIEQIVIATLENITCFAMLSILLLFILHASFPVRGFIFIYSIYGIIIIFARILYREIIRHYRKIGGNSRQILFIGSSHNLVEIYENIILDPTTGYHLAGYFDNTPSSKFNSNIIYLGTPEEVISYLNNHKPDQIYCALPSSQQNVILPIISYCENNFIRFFSVPNVRNYLKHSMKFELIGDTPVLGVLEEPLEQYGNKLVKRIFDILFSFIFLVTLFPIIFIIVGIGIKLSSKGPIFFKQLRSGHDGKTFYCYKFRSMKVNEESDTQMATKNDPRTTCIGKFLRKYNIDEFPQFINVLKGDMSIVGPRPHMIKHTEEYSKLIGRFMLRYYVKPGITGWAQVRGYRGEIKELWQMEKRVEYDIWYIEHWSLLLDIRIIMMTIINMIKGEKNAY